MQIESFMINEIDWRNQRRHLPAKRIFNKSNGWSISVDVTPPDTPATMCSYFTCANNPLFLLLVLLLIAAISLYINFLSQQQNIVCHSLSSFSWLCFGLCCLCCLLCSFSLTFRTVEPSSPCLYHNGKFIEFIFYVFYSIVCGEWTLDGGCS